MMRNTIYCETDRPVEEAAVRESVERMVEAVRTYVPGYRLRVPPLVKDCLVTTMVEVEGAGDHLPKYSGNLDIITAAAVGVAERLADHWQKNGERIMAKRLRIVDTTLRDGMHSVGAPVHARANDPDRPGVGRRRHRRRRSLPW